MRGEMPYHRALYPLRIMVKQRLVAGAATQRRNEEEVR